jgi:hypothetical protein
VGDWDDATVSALCVEGEEDYGFGLNATTPIRDRIASLFGDIVVEDGCDATITVSASGKALSATYAVPESPGSGVVFYTGAEVQGTISLKAEGESPLTATIAGYRSPPRSLTVGAINPRAPEGAPFWGVVYGNVCLVLQRWFGADDPHLGSCPEPEIVTPTTMPGHTPWSEEVRAGFLDGCLQHESMCLCLLYGAESVLTEAEWLGVRDLDDGSWPEDVWNRVSAAWSECSSGT